MPVSISVKAELNRKKMPQRLKTISMRSINECPLGYVDDKMKFHDTGEFFAAYVNEEHPQIDKLLREALDTRLVNRFLGYQGDTSQSENVDKQVYALWNVLQNVTLNIVPQPIAVCRRMWFILSVCVRWMMHWSLRR